MHLINRNPKRSKKVFARKPHSNFYVKETIFIEDYQGSPKRRDERLYIVEDFTFNGLKAAY